MDEIMAIYPPAWQAMQPIIEAHQRGVTVTREQAAERAGLSRRTSAPPAPPGVAVIPLVGFLSRRPGLLAQLFGASSSAGRAMKAGAQIVPIRSLSRYRCRSLPITQSRV